MRKIIWIVIFVAVAGIFTKYVVIKIRQFYTLDNLQSSWPQQVLAVYDKRSNTIIYNNDSVLHYTLSWVNNTEKSLPIQSINLLIEKKLPIFFNLQIWSGKLLSKLDKPVLNAIVNGDFDAKLIAFFKLLDNSKETIYLRYNAEMEMPLYNKFPWQNQGATQYINSFRHVALLCKKYSPSVKIIWGPSGYPGSEEYWPGEGYVDINSVNIDTAKEIKNDPYPPNSSVEEMIRLKLFRMRFMNKPIYFLSSATVTRDSFKKQWLSELNNKLIADKTIYQSTIIPFESDSTTIKKERETNLKIGVYDPLLKLINQPLITVEHIFTDMKSVENGLFKKQFNEVIDRKHDVIVTIEPWKDNSIERDSAILTNTLLGKYDKIWNKLYQDISNIPQTIYLRWGHEMEIPVDRYPWQKQDPVSYIKAFRYFATFQPIKANNIKIVWGPAGDRGSVEWWPGEDVVDFVSIAIYGLPDKNINDYNKQQSFTTIFQNKFHRLRFAHRPLFITEFGVKGPEDYKMKWLKNAAETINKYPEIKGICYFNFADTPKAWGNAETPDWSITPITFKSFTALLNDLPKNNAQ